jgi:hypothetical protein
MRTNEYRLTASRSSASRSRSTWAGRTESLAGGTSDGKTPSSWGSMSATVTSGQRRGSEFSRASRLLSLVLSAESSGALRRRGEQRDRDDDQGGRERRRVERADRLLNRRKYRDAAEQGRERNERPPDRRRDTAPHARFPGRSGPCCAKHARGRAPESRWASPLLEPLGTSCEPVVSGMRAWPRMSRPSLIVNTESNRRTVSLPGRPQARRATVSHLSRSTRV